MTTKLHFRLTTLGIQLREEFESKYSNENHCTCNDMYLCNYCTHPGNPTNIDSNDDCWTSEIVATSNEESNV